MYLYISLGSAWDEEPEHILVEAICVAVILYLVFARETKPPNKKLSVKEEERKFAMVAKSYSFDNPCSLNCLFR